MRLQKLEPGKSRFRKDVGWLQLAFVRTIMLSNLELAFFCKGIPFARENRTVDKASRGLPSNLDNAFFSTEFALTRKHRVEMTFFPGRIALSRRRRVHKALVFFPEKSRKRSWKVPFVEDQRVKKNLVFWDRLKQSPQKKSGFVSQNPPETSWRFLKIVSCKPPFMNLSFEKTSHCYR